MSRWIGVLVLSGLLFGCGDDDVAPDAGSTDGGVADAQVMVDGGSVDAGPVEGCEAGEVLVRGRCIASCGLDGEAIDAELGATLAPLAGVCRPAVAVDAVVRADGRLAVYELTASTEGDVTRFVLTRALVAADGSVSAPEDVASTTHAGHAAGAIYVGSYVAISPDERGAVFGYTTSDAGFVGGVFDVEVGDGTAEELLAPSNYDAAWLDEDRWLLSGLSLGEETGQGLYLRDRALGASRLAVGDIGDYSGTIAVVGEHVIAGAARAFGETWPDGSEGDRVFVLDAAMLRDATAPISAWDDALTHAALPSTFEVLFGELFVSVARDDLWNVVGIDARALDVDGSAVVSGDPEPLTVGSTFVGAFPAGPRHALLVHAGGTLVVARGDE